MQQRVTIIYHKVLSILPVILLSAAFILYYPSIDGEFIIDDFSYFVDNDILKNLTPWNIKAIFLYPSNYWGELLPMRDYLYVLEYNAFGEWTGGYHLISLAIFLVSALSLFYFARILFKDFDEKRRNFSLIAGCFVMTLFLFNPLYVETTAYISGQKDLLALLFTLLSLSLLYKVGRSSTQSIWLAFIGGVLCYYLGVLSKFSILPLILFIPFLWFYTSDMKKKSLKKIIFFWALAQIPVILLMYYNIVTTSNLIQQTISTPFLERIPRALNILGIQISHIVWPVNLSFGYFYNKTWHLNIYFFIGLAFLIGMTLLFLKRRASIYTWGLLFFVLFLIPSLQVFIETPNAHIYNRYLAIPLIGLFIALTDLIYKYYIASKKNQFIIILCFSTIITFWGEKTSEQIVVFKSNLNVMQNMYYVNPTWDEAAYKYIIALIDENKLEYANYLLDEQIQFPESSGINELLKGTIYRLKGKLDSAKELLIISSVKENKSGRFPLANFELALVFIQKNENLLLARDLLIEQLTHPAKASVELNKAKQLLDFVEKKLRSQELK